MTDRSDVEAQQESTPSSRRSSKRRDSRRDRQSDWIEEPEPEPEPTKHRPGGKTERRDHQDALGSANVSTGSYRDQLGRRNSRGSRYQHVGQLGGVSQHDRLPPNSLHRLLPKDWGQGKRQRAINRYKKDLRQAEEELQQLHFSEQSGGLPDTPKQPGAVEPSVADDLVWEYYADIINSGDFSTDGIKPWTGSYAATLAKSRTKCISGGDKHSSHSDEELIAALPNTYFKPIVCDEEETAFTGPTTIADEKRVFRRHDRLVRQESDIHSQGNWQGCRPFSTPHPSGRRSSQNPSYSSTPSDTRQQLRRRLN